MKYFFIICTLLSCTGLNAQNYPTCLVPKIATYSNLPYTVKAATCAGDTVFVVLRQKAYGPKVSRHEIQMKEYEKQKPAYVQPEVYDTNCRRLIRIKNADLSYLK